MIINSPIIILRHINIGKFVIVLYLNSNYINTKNRSLLIYLVAQFLAQKLALNT